MSKITDKQGFGKEELHLWWSLSYAQYLTIPRSVMQEMPEPWQAQMAKLLFELDETMDWRPKEGKYWCRLKDAKGRFVDDPFREYRHGNKHARAAIRAYGKKGGG